MTTMCMNAEEALRVIKSGDKIWCHSMAATPSLLLNALAKRVKELQRVELLQLHLENAEAICQPELEGHLRNRCYFASTNTRDLISEGKADYVPIFLSEIPRLFRSGEQPIDVALIQVSPPDRHGNCSLGVSVEATRAACEMADIIIAQINPVMPRTHGDSVIPLARIDYAIEAEAALPSHAASQANALYLKIGQHVAGLVEDGDCLQMGIGAIPDAALTYLTEHKNLGIHTEMFSDGLIPLIEQGVVNNRNKKIHRGRVVTGFVVGSQKLYDFVNDNPQIAFLDIEYVNNPAVIRKNPQAVSINSALEVDLTGQVCADSIGSKIYSGVGGQVDFVTGSQLSEGGRSILAFPATAMRGQSSRIVKTLTSGAGVVTTRAQVDHIVTEFGVASLRGCSLRERAERLINIAHPDFQAKLSEEAGL